jgi:hypothetical protein
MSIAEPTIQELIDIAAQAIRGGADKTADFVSGSDYESLIGPAAMLWSRQAMRDTDMFNAVNFRTADGKDLTNLVRKRYGKERVLDTRGQGTARLVRPAGGIAESIWKGTRLLVPGPKSKVYRTTKTVEVPASEVMVDVPIESLIVGPGSAIDLGSSVARVDDSLKDSTWTVQSLRCADGTLFEKAEAFRERIRRERLDERVGQEKLIEDVCKAQGAGHVICFRSNFAGEDYDHGLNVVYVGNLGYVGTPELVKACTLALDDVRVLGDHLQVLPMARVDLAVDADVVLHASPALFDLARLERIHHTAVTQYLNGSSGSFTYSRDGIGAAIARMTREVQRVDLVTPSADVQIVEGDMRNFPAVLNRYVPSSITLRYKGP